MKRRRRKNPLLSRAIPKGQAAAPRASLPPFLDLVLILVAIAGAVLLFLVREHRTAGQWGFSLDDSWIHAAFAKNIATGHGFSFNADHPVAGSTGPLYSILIALLFGITQDMIWSAKVLGILWQAGAALLTYHTSLHLRPGARAQALFVGLLVGISPSLVWASISGMEISVYLLLVCLGIYFYAQGRDVAATLAWAVGVWVRPDGLFLVALSLIGPRRTLGKRMLVLVPVLAVYLAFNLAVGGSLLPQTVAAKTHFALDLSARTTVLLREWGTLWGIPFRRNDQLEHPALLLLLAAVGAAVTIRRYPALALYWLGLPVVLSLFRENSASHKRYILYVIPFGMLLAAQGIAFLTRRLKGRQRRAVLVSSLLVCATWQGIYLDHKATSHGWNVQNINRMQRWLGTMARGLTEPGDAIAASDIGAIGYFSGRPVIDLMGLVAARRPLPENLSRYRPKLLIVDIEWFLPYVRRDPPSGYFAFFDADSTHKYAPLGAVELLNNTICSTNQMIVFTRQGLNDPPVPNKFRYRF